MNFALIGAAGYIAPKHLDAIKAVNGNLIAAIDPSDSVGILDSYFLETAFFTEFERFDRHLEKEKRKGTSIDYLVICSPNYLHDAHIRYGLRIGAHIICEKPLVLNPWNIDHLEVLERESGKKINNILQLRLHPELNKLKTSLGINKKHEVELTYITTRGNWYYASWKGDEAKSGGIVTNIGIHFFDALIWLFGPVIEIVMHRNHHDSAAGIIKLENANVKWFLSINKDHLKDERKVMRQLTIDGEAVDFTHGFNDLHIQSYKGILAGEGFGTEVVKPSIDLVHQIRTSVVVATSGEAHPMADLPLSKHPFKK